MKDFDPPLFAFHPCEWLIDAACIGRFLRTTPKAETLEEPTSVAFMEPGPSGKKIARINLLGLLAKGLSPWFASTSTITARRDLQQAVADPDVAGVMLAIDSPGGYIAGTDDLAREIRSARRQKPVWAYVDDLAASAAYWAASQTDRVVANSPVAMVGSIGTYQSVPDFSAMFEKAGVKVHVIKTGPLKAAGAMGDKITDEQVSHWQALVNSVQEQFDTAVQKGRNLSAKELADVRHGGVLTATAALKSKLIDAVQPYSKTMAEFSAALKGGPEKYGRALELLASGKCVIDDTGCIAPEPIKEDARRSRGTFPMVKLAGLPVLSASEN